MPRKSRKDYNTPFFHVMVQGINREYIFEQKKYKEKFCQLLKEARDFNIEIMSYCIMDNHTHIVLKIEKYEDMSNFMGHINLKFARYYNYEQDRVGTVFRGRYKSQPIYSEKSLCRCIEYIHNNPVKAGIVRKKEDYFFSSYREYINSSDGENYNLDIIKDSKKMLELKRIFEGEGELENEKDIDEEFIEYRGNKEEIIQIVKAFESRVGMNIEEIKQNAGVMSKLIKEIKIRANGTNLRIAKVLEISRTTVERMLEKK